MRSVTQRDIKAINATALAKAYYTKKKARAEAIKVLIHSETKALNFVNNVNYFYVFFLKSLHNNIYKEIITYWR